MIDIYLSVCHRDGYDYDLYTNTCLRYYNYSLSPVTWISARNICQNAGGDLMAITTREKLDLIVETMNCKFFFLYTAIIEIP